MALVSLFSSLSKERAMKRKHAVRVPMFEVYADDAADDRLAIQKLNRARNEIDQERERIVLIAVKELKYPEKEITG